MVSKKKRRVWEWLWLSSIQWWRGKKKEKKERKGEEETRRRKTEEGGKETTKIKNMRKKSALLTPSFNVQGDEEDTKAPLHDMVHHIISCPHPHTRYNPQSIQTANHLIYHHQLRSVPLLPFTSPYHTKGSIIILLMWGYHSSTHPFSFLHICLPYSSFLSCSLLRPSQIYKSAFASPGQTGLAIV